MQSETGIALRSERPSLAMRAANWLLARRKPVFPRDAAAFAAAMAGRKRPEDAPIPRG